MEIIGSGFLAGQFERIVGSHAHTVVLAAGVSSTLCTSDAEFHRENWLVGQVLKRCERTGERLVFLSTASTAMYGGSALPGREDEPASPRSPYGLHKLLLENVLTGSAADYLVLRLGHVVGPRQPPHQLVPSVINQLLAGTVRVHQGASRDLIHVDEVVRIVDELLTVGVSREVVNVASGTSVPIDRVIDHLEAALGTAARRVPGENSMPNRVCIDKLLSLVKGEWGFGPDYPLAVLDRYLMDAELPRFSER